MKYALLFVLLNSFVTSPLFCQAQPSAQEIHTQSQISPEELKILVTIVSLGIVIINNTPIADPAFKATGTFDAQQYPDCKEVSQAIKEYLQGNAEAFNRLKPFLLAQVKAA